MLICPTCSAPMQKAPLLNRKGTAYICPTDATHWEIVLED